MERAAFRDKSRPVTAEGYNAGLAVIEMVAVGKRASGRASSIRQFIGLILVIHAYVDVNSVPNHLLH